VEEKEIVEVNSETKRNSMKRFDSSTGQAGVSQTGREVVSKDNKQVGTSSSVWRDPSTHRVELLNRLVSVEDYEPFIGLEVVDRILRKAKALQAFRVLNFNSTFYGGGVAELLSGMTLLMNSLGIKAEWRVIQGRPDFFNITKKMHNALQGADINLSEIKASIFEEVNFENAVRNRIDHDIVLVHDPQPLPLIDHFPKKCPWLWRCHIVEKYDAVILSRSEYQQNLPIPQLIFMPAIDPFLDQYKIPVDLPLVVQVSRFDRWKDPQGVVEAFKLAQKEIDATLVLLGNFATDDPEGALVYEHLASIRDERILVLPNGDDTALVNTLQRRAAVVLQKSLREGFGLTVAEAMWKGTPVIGGNVWRYSLPDSGRNQRFPCFLGRGSRAPDRTIAERCETERRDGAKSSADRCRPLFAHPLSGTVSWLVWLV
jgi:trehalose synthase